MTKSMLSTRTKTYHLHRHILVSLTMATCLAFGVTQAKDIARTPLDPYSWAYVTVGVRDLDTAQAFWLDQFGFEIVAEKDGHDPGLAKLWSLKDGDISRQAMLRTPGIETGGLHLVEFKNPGPPVRQGAKAYDLVPKNLDVHIQDLDATFAALKTQGFRFRANKISEAEVADGTRFREIQMPGHDDTNIVLIEIPGEAQPFTTKGAAGLGMVVITVSDADAEKTFYREILELEMLSENLLKGPEIETMVGLPKGAGIDVAILGKPDKDFGRIEIVEYQGLQGENLHPRAAPKALGMLHVSYLTQDLTPLKLRLDDNNVPYESYETVETLFGIGPVLAFRSPAGFRIEVHQPE